MLFGHHVSSTSEISFVEGKPCNLAGLGSYIQGFERRRMLKTKDMMHKYIIQSEKQSEEGCSPIVEGVLYRSGLEPGCGLRFWSANGKPEDISGFTTTTSPMQGWQESQRRKRFDFARAILFSCTTPASRTEFLPKSFGS